jgi:hypothetical protein
MMRDEWRWASHENGSKRDKDENETKQLY